MRFLIQASIPGEMLNKMVQDSDKFLEKAENYTLRSRSMGTSARVSGLSPNYWF